MQPTRWGGARSGSCGKKPDCVPHGGAGPFAVAGGVVGAAQPEPRTPVPGSSFSFLAVLLELCVGRCTDNALVGGGGRESQCGWCVDRFGLSWQIVPQQLTALLTGPHAEAVTAELMTQVKLDIARLEAAAG